MEYYLLQGVSAVVILRWNNFSGALIFHRSITPDIDTGNLRIKQFLVGLDHVNTVASLYSVPSQN